MKRTKIQKDFPEVVDLYLMMEDGELKAELGQLLAYAGAAEIVEAELAADRKAIEEERNARGE